MEKQAETIELLPGTAFKSHKVLEDLFDKHQIPKEFRQRIAIEYALAKTTHGIEHKHTFSDYAVAHYMVMRQCACPECVGEVMAMLHCVMAPYNSSKTFEESVRELVDILLEGERERQKGAA